MSIKKFFAGMAVLLSVSLFVIGCPTEPADGNTGAPGAAGSSNLPNGTSFDGLRDAIDGAVETGASITLDGITLSATGTEVIDFKTAKVRIVGTLATTGGGTVVLNAADAAVTLGTNAAVALAAGHTLITKTADIPEGAGHLGTVAAPIAVADLGSFAGDVTAVENYTLGDNATPFGPGSTLRVFVYGDLTIDDESVAPTAGTVVAIGNVKLTENVGATVLADSGSASSVDVSAGVISIVGNKTVTVTLPTAIAGYRFNLTGEQDKLSVSGTTSIEADVRGNGTLELKEAVTVANIAGTGRIDFNGAAVTAFSAADHVIRAQSVKFTKGFTTPLSPATNTLTLKGAVTVPKDAVIGFGVANGVFILEAGSTLWNAESTAVKLLTADEDVTVKGSAATDKLTVTAAGIEQDTTGTAPHTVTITGEATLGKGAAYTVKSVENKKGTLVLDTGAILTLEADETPATLVLTGAAVAANAAALGGVGKVVAGKTEITGGNASGTWTAVGAATDVTISPDTIATGAGTALTADHANSLIEVKAGGTLTLTGAVTLDATPYGKVVLTGAASDGGAKLAGAGKVNMGNANITGGASGSWQAVGATTSIALTATAITGTGTSPVLAAADPTADTAVITLATEHTNGNAAALTVTNATIDLSAKGAVVFPYVSTTAATLVLKGGSDTLGALKLGSGTVDNTNVNLTAGSHSVIISGSSTIIKGASASAGVAAGLISGGATISTNDATITGQTTANDVTIKAGATLADSAS